jgi:ParB-like chromosome segregation protein Spo0J
VAQHIAEQGLSVRRAEEYVAQLNNSVGKSVTQSARREPSRATFEDDLIVRQLEERLGGVRVKLVRSGDGGRLVMHFDNEEMLGSLYELLMSSVART